ncbi:MAG: cytochrome c-type biogenesis protein CcmH [Myxococcota bacterium]|nr:cytochrome c-type biogenesis protein CcmH [Myxococcota bacterium]
MLGVYLMIFAASNAGDVLPVSELPEPAKIVGNPQGSTIAVGPELEAITEAVGSRMRCPVCQGSSVSASPSEMARNMKAQVKEMLADGYTEEQIFLYFEASYGEFVRLEPKKEGMKWGVWLLPLFAGIVGLLSIVGVLRRYLASSLPTSDDSQNAEMVEYEAELLRVRALVSGEAVSDAG